LGAEKHASDDIVLQFLRPVRLPCTMQIRHQQTPVAIKREMHLLLSLVDNDQGDMLG